MARTTKKRATLPVARAKRLPKTFRGAAVVRGLGMTSEQVDKLVEKKAITCFDWFGEPRDLWVVVADDSLSLRGFSATYIKAFVDEASALRYARARGNGNVNQRVLHVTDQTLVVATEQDLEDE